MSRKFSEKVTYLIEHFMEYLNQGYSIPEIAEKFDVSPHTIYHNLDKIAKLNNVARGALLERKVPSSEVINNLIEHFMEYHNQGYSITEIAEKFGVNRTTIYNNIDQIAKLNNISRETLVGNCSGRKSSKKTDDLIEHFMEYLNQGYSIPEIAEKFGVHNNTVYRNLDKIAKLNNISREALLSQINYTGCTPTQRMKNLIEHFMEYHNQGYSIPEIAEKFGVHYTGIYRNLDKIAKINNTTREDLLTRNSSSGWTRNATYQSQIKVDQTYIDNLEEDFFRLYETIDEAIRKAGDLITNDE